MTRWLVTGGSGQLGVDVVRVLRERGQEVIGCGRDRLDVTSARTVDEVLSEHRPSVVVNCAAYTAVDQAEQDEATAHAVNVEGPRLIGEWCAARGATVVHVSTDYVFAGDAGSPYAEDAPVAPLSVYGRSKAEGERLLAATGAHAHVVRTSWLYGAHGPNFVRTIARLAAEREVLDVVDDQRGSPTWTRHLAHGLVDLAGSGASPGIWHCTNAGETTWFGLARAVFAELGLDPERVRPTTTEAFPRPAHRPAYSVLSNEKWTARGLAPLPDWRSALHQALPELGLVGAAPAV